jgi:hypothetical protein
VLESESICFMLYFSTILIHATTTPTTTNQRFEV